jgi:malate dehydrogenase (quinone)
MPLVMQDRQAGEPLAATRVDRGTDIDFGVLTRLLFEGLAGRADFQLHLNHQVKRLRRDSDGMWRLTVKDRVAGESRQLRARFVFLGAGGGALPLLQSSGIPEAKGYAGFPVSGQWLVCKDPAVVERHMAKVYGLAAVGAPPMSVPHLDTRFTNGSRALLFGPYAGFSTKYLKEGSFWDLPGSLRFNNLWPMLAVARDNMDLTRYLIGEVLQSEEARMRTLQTFMPTARIQDWKLEVAGQRVQIIKRDQNRGGRLEFGTEVVASADGTLGALLGASPGASTAAATMLEVIRRCSGATPGAEEFARSLRLLIPSYGRSLAAEPDLLRTVRDRTNKVMGLNA